MPRSLLLAIVAVLAVLALPSSAFGQATRTWVSGVGDDANPCSRTAPCKTFAGAISKTATGGEINVLDPGGFGGVTITKSLTIRARGNTAGALVSGTNAIVVNAGATGKVTLDGLDINGIGSGAPTSLTGVKVLTASRVNITNSEIFRFKAGVAVVPTSANTRVVMKNNHVYDNDIGVITAPGAAGISRVDTVMRDNLVNDNICGVVTGAFGTNASTPVAATNCGTAALGAINVGSNVRMWSNSVHDNQFGVFSRGALAFADLGDNVIQGNTTFGLRRFDTGNIRTTSPATNVFTNAADDAPNLTIPLG